MLPNPVVSVVIPAFNASRWIRSTLESASTQTLREIEIILVDDGSTDATFQIGEDFAKKDSRVRLIRITNGGVGEARNAGIRAARGKYIAPLDADDLWETEKLEMQVRRMEERGEQTGLVYCWSHYIDGNGNHLGANFPAVFEGEARRAVILYNFIGNASVPLFRASALRESGLYLTRNEQRGAQGCEDWDLSIRIAEKHQVGVTRQSLVNYRQDESAMSSRAEGMARSFRIVMDQVRRRNPDIPPLLFRCSAVQFFGFLASKSYRNRDFYGCLLASGLALRSDPITLLNRKLIGLAMKSFVWLAFGRQHRSIPRLSFRKPARARRINSLPLPDTCFGRLQSKRWYRVLRDGR